MALLIVEIGPQMDKEFLINLVSPRLTTISILYLVSGPETIDKKKEQRPSA